MATRTQRNNSAYLSPLVDGILLSDNPIAVETLDGKQVVEPLKEAGKQTSDIHGLFSFILKAGPLPALTNQAHQGIPNQVQPRILNRLVRQGYVLAHEVMSAKSLDLVVGSDQTTHSAKCANICRSIRLLFLLP